MPILANQRIEQWLDGERAEPVLDPALPIVDPHHHLWDLRTATIEPLLSFEQKVYLCEEMSAEIAAGGHNVVQTVFAQCMAFYRADGPEALRCVGETEFAHGIAAMSRSGVYGPMRLCTGIFTSADLRAGKDVEHVLLAHMAVSPNFRGIRSAVPRNLDGAVMDGAFMDGIAMLARYGLSLDHYSPDYERLNDLVRLANAQPDLTIIVNHLGGRANPNASSEEFARWRACIDAVAACPNVVIKLGGAQQRVGPWEPPFHMHRRPTPIGSEELCELVYPGYQHALQAFGPTRCMFESNFPVDKECVSYRTLWNTFKRIARKAALSEHEITQVFSATAARVYRLDLGAPAK